MKWMLIALFIIFSSACSQAPSGSKETAAELASRAAQENFEVIIEDAASLADPNFEPQEAFQIEASAIPQNAALVEQMLGNTPISGDKLSATHHIALLPTAESIDGLYNAQEIQVRLKRDGTVIALGILPREQIDAGERSVSVTTKTLVVNTMAQKLGMTYDNLLPLVNNEITSSFQAITAAMNFDSEKPPSFTSYVSLLKDYATKIAWTTETVKTAILSAGVKRKTLLTSMPLFDDARLRADFTSLLGSEATDQILHSMASATTAATDEDTSKEKTTSSTTSTTTTSTTTNTTTPIVPAAGTLSFSASSFGFSLAGSSTPSTRLRTYTPTIKDGTGATLSSGFSCSLSAGILPSGITLTASTCALSGVVTATFSTTTVKIKVTYTDSNNLSVEKEIPVSYERYCGGLGTFDSPYLLCDKESFVGITSDDITEKYFALTVDINLTGVGEALGSSSECFIYGENGNVNYHFNSYIDGRNHTVSNYTCTTSSTSNQYGIGLFQKVNDPTYGDSSYSFKDITFDHFSITAAAATWVGALAGGGATTFKNVKITNAAITGKTSVGGFIGFSEGSEIIDSSYSGTVNGNTTTGQNVGGFIGRIGSTGSCKNSSFSGTVTAATNTGGLFGIILGGNVDGDGNPLPTNPKIQDCTFVTGSTVTGTSKVGGIVGTISVNSSIDGAKSYGSVVATTGTSGGICGDCSAPIANVTVQILDNNGNVHATNGVKSNGFLYAGGIAGTLAGSGSITNATVKARIYALAGAAGGIAGSSGGAISGSRFEGVVTGGGSLGGILGLASSSFGTVSNATVTNLTISGTSNLAGGIVGDAKGTISGANLTLSSISGTNMVGGIAGRSTAAIDNNSVASTTVTGTDKVGVIIGTTTSTTSGNSWTPGSFTCSTNCNPTP